MDAVKITTSLSDLFTQGLGAGTLERIGGVIREVATGRIVAFLRELGQLQGAASGLVGFLGSSSGLGVLNLGVATMGFVVLLKRVNTIEQGLQRTQELLQQVNQKLISPSMPISAPPSILRRMLSACATPKIAMLTPCKRSIG